MKQRYALDSSSDSPTNTVGHFGPKRTELFFRPSAPSSHSPIYPCSNWSEIVGPTKACERIPFRGSSGDLDRGNFESFDSKEEVVNDGRDRNPSLRLEMFVSRPAVHPVEAPPLTDAAENPPRVRMKDIQGMPGTPGGLALRFFQFAFAVAALGVMVSTSDFASVTAFW
ncbi:hypothetical protein BHM03_00001218 [Ensete ventricosum]|uniref:CASP-like protein n=1 Tax=Ensete ventricosum TaxID=4639 RepID=A0A445M919_ENSVE|nr:hypothetical protein BHM03_00001218 [Ensete ventricosum]